MLRKGICEPSTPRCAPHKPCKEGGGSLHWIFAIFAGCSRSWAGGPAPPALPPPPLRFQGPPGQGDSDMQKAGCHLKPQEELLPRGRAAGMLEGVSRHSM